jgi:aryl-alcohol dehydrogenase-like predicted oxidoreductase
MLWRFRGGVTGMTAQTRRRANAAEDNRGSPQRVTLAWLLAKAPVAIPVPGAGRPESIIDSAQPPELALSRDELARLDADGAGQG